MHTRALKWHSSLFIQNRHCQWCNFFHLTWWCWPLLFKKAISAYTPHSKKRVGNSHNSFDNANCSKPENCFSIITTSGNCRFKTMPSLIAISDNDICVHCSFDKNFVDLNCWERLLCIPITHKWHHFTVTAIHDTNACCYVWSSIALRFVGQK